MLFLHLLPGLLVTLIGLAFRKWPPRPYNRLYGYHTRYAMRSPEIWREGNRYYARLLIGSGLLDVLTGWVCYYTLPLFTGLLLPIGVLLVLLVLTLLLTESHLKRKFGR
ncbi:SdpI family protein [Pontibacter ummariensis]|nr:SdpI family protein [Pontibacter ummariensis]